MAPAIRANGNGVIALRDFTPAGGMGVMPVAGLA